MVGWRYAWSLLVKKRKTVIRACRHVSADLSARCSPLTSSIIMTGWGMSAHEQSLMISTKVSLPFLYLRPWPHAIG